MPAEELFDLEKDPHEIRNLVDSKDPEHQAALRRLRAALEQWMDDCNDQGRTPEPPEVAAAEGRTKPAAPKAKAGGAKKTKRSKAKN